MLHVFYRISDKGHKNGKPLYINIRTCLTNFLKVFSDIHITFIADNCDVDTINWLKTFNKEIIQTKLGNAASFLYTLDLALSRISDNEYVYFVEDDYLHYTNSKCVLLEGLNIFDYVTLYDHPDKYMNPSPNMFVKNGSEDTNVYLTKSTHWKRTNSTTMTFASKVSTLREDLNVFDRFCIDRNIPDDFSCFITLTIHKQRKVGSPIPGFSTHGEKLLLSPFRNWEAIALQ